MKPTIGRIVTYATTATEQKQINEHPRNTPQEKSPAMIVAVNEDDSVNLKVFIDGWGEIYSKNVKEGDQAGQYTWPAIPKKPQAEPAIAEDPQAEPAIAEDPQAEPAIAEAPQAEPEIVEAPQAEPEKKKITKA